MELAAGLIDGPLDAAPRRPGPVPRPRAVTLGAQPSSPAAAVQNRDEKQFSQKDDAAHDDEACVARLRAAGGRFDIPRYRSPPRPCALSRSRSVATRAQTVTEVHLPEEPVVSCQF